MTLKICLNVYIGGGDDWPMVMVNEEFLKIKKGSVLAERRS